MWWRSWCKLGNEDCQDLPFDRCSRLESDSEGPDLRDPLRDSTVSLRILHNGSQRVLCQHDDGEGLKVVLQLPRGDEESEHYLFNPCVPCLSVDQCLADTVERLLDAPLLEPKLRLSQCRRLRGRGTLFRREVAWIEVDETSYKPSDFEMPFGTDRSSRSQLRSS